MGDEPDKSEASTAGGTEGGDASKAESGAAGDADAGGAQTKVVLAAVVGIVVTIVIIIVLLIPKGSATGTTTPKVEEAASNKTGNATEAPTTKAPAPTAETPKTPPVAPDLHPTGGQKEKIPDVFTVCVVKDCVDLQNMGGCTEIIIMNDDTNVETLKKVESTGIRHYIGFEYSNKPTAAAIATVEKEAKIAGYALLSIEAAADLESDVKDMKKDDKLLILSFKYDDKSIKVDVITKLKPDLIILETHMKQGSKGATLNPVVWVKTAASGAATFDQVKATLTQLKTTGAKLSISASAFVFPYKSADEVKDGELFTKSLDGEVATAKFDETGCAASIEDSDNNVAVVADKDKKLLQVYENKQTLDAKLKAAKPDATTGVGWTLFDATCQDPPKPSQCPLRYLDPTEILKNKDIWTPSSSGTTTVKTAPDISLFCVISPCATNTEAPPEAVLKICKGIIYFDPTWDMAAAPTDTMYATFVQNVATTPDLYYIGVSYENFKTAQYDETKFPTEFSKGVALMDIDSTKDTDVNDKVTKLTHPSVVAGIKSEVTPDEPFVDGLITAGAYVILQTISQPQAGTPCKTVPTSPWELPKPLLTDTTKKIAVSFTLQGLTYTYTANPPATAAAALDKAAPVECGSSVVSDLATDCTGASEATDKSNEVLLDTTASTATVYETVATLTDKKTGTERWAVFWKACSTREATCPKVDDLLNVFKP